MTNVAGVRREFDAEIIEQIPDVKVAWVTVGGQSEQSGLVTFRPIDRSQVKGDLKRFKYFIENRGMETGAWRGTV